MTTSGEMLTHNSFINHFGQWVERIEDIRFAAMVGSLARTNSIIDKFSDVDIVIFTHRPRYYLEKSKWLIEFGEVLISIVNAVSEGIPQRRIVFTNGLISDMLFYSVSYLKKMSHHGYYPNCFRKGFKVLVDKDNFKMELSPPVFTPPFIRPPSQDEFLQIIDLFLMKALSSCKKIKRKELWNAKYLDHSLKKSLLQMLEWYTKSKKGWDTDTSYDGLNLESWIVSELSGKLKSLFSGYNQIESYNALLCQVELFISMAEEIAFTLNYAFPVTKCETVYKWLIQSR